MTAASCGSMGCFFWNTATVGGWHPEHGVIDRACMIKPWFVHTGTALTGAAITDGTHLVTVKMGLGMNIWIVGLVDLQYLEMVKLR